MISRDIDDRTDPDVDDEKPSHRGSDVQPANYSNVNNQLSTQDDVTVKVHKNTAYTNEDHNSFLFFLFLFLFLLFLMPMCSIFT